MLCRHRACPPKMGRRHRHVCCRHLLSLCRHRARTEKIGAQASPCLLQASAYALQASRLSQKMWRRHRHVCCRHLLLFCRHRVHMENRAQAPYPVWGFKNLKDGRCRGEAVANATAVRIEGSIVCKTSFQTG